MHGIEHADRPTQVRNAEGIDDIEETKETDRRFWGDRSVDALNPVRRHLVDEDERHRRAPTESDDVDVAIAVGEVVAQGVVGFGDAWRPSQPERAADRLADNPEARPDAWDVAGL